MDDSSKELSGTRILIAEDEPIVALDHADRLIDAGAEIVGPCAFVTHAMECLENDDVDVAVIDYVLGDGNTEPLQHALERKHVPYVIVTAYPRVLVRRDEQQTIHTKPVSSETLCAAVKAVRGGRRSG